MNNDELTSQNLKRLLVAKWPELRDTSVANIKRYRKRLVWVATRPRYCQLIWELNKDKRLEWRVQCCLDGEEFTDVIFSDESIVALETHGRIVFRKENQPCKLKGRAKHPVKVYVWIAISQCSASHVVLFNDIANECHKIYILPY